MPIEIAAEGRLGGPQMRRTSQKGTPWLSLSIAVNTGEEREWISISVFGEVMESLPADLVPGEKLYVEGKLRVNRYTDKDGKERASLQVTASRVLVLDRIGRRARGPRRSKQQEADAEHVS